MQVPLIDASSNTRTDKTKKKKKQTSWNHGTLNSI